MSLLKVGRAAGSQLGIEQIVVDCDGHREISCKDFTREPQLITHWR